MPANIVRHPLRLALVKLDRPVDVVGAPRLALAVGVAVEPANALAALRHKGIAPVDAGLVAVLVVGECLGPVGAASKGRVVLPEGRAVEDAAGRVDVV